MSHGAGTLERVVLSRTLWFIVLAPLLGCAWHLVVARRRATSASPAAASGPRALLWSQRVAVGCVACSVEAMLGHLLVLARDAGGRGALVQWIGGGVRMGELDLAFAFRFDRVSAVAVALVEVAALGTVAAVSRGPQGEGSWRAWAWIELSLAGALVAFLGDGFVTTALGWTLVAAAQGWLAGWGDAARGAVVATRGSLSIGVMALGAAALFWGLGGGWEGDDYVRDRSPRFAATQLSGGGAQGASLTMTDEAGAVVSADDVRATAVTAPFVRASLAPGRHMLRVHAGEGTSDTVLGPIAVSTGDAFSIEPVGPTLTYSAAIAQLSLRDPSGGPALSEVLADRAGPVGSSAVGAAFLAILMASLALSAHLPPPGAPVSLATMAWAASVTAVGPFLVVRLAPFLKDAPTPLRASVAVWGGVAGVVWLAGAVRLVAAARRKSVALPPAPSFGLQEWSLEALPHRLGELLVTFERWVVDAAAGAAAALFAVSVWVAARVDGAVLAAPGDAMATRALRARRALDPAVGGSIARLVWIVLGLFATSVLASALWSR